MLDTFLMLLAMAAQGEGEPPTTAVASAGGTAVATEAEDTGTGETGAEAAQARVAEPQTPTGRFTTATEVRPILDMTRGNWVAVREYDGHDLVYFTHLMSWRCGLTGMRYAINDGPVQEYDLPACDESAAAPNAMPPDWMPIMGLAPQSVQKIYVEIDYDDLSQDSATFDRAGVEIP